MKIKVESCYSGNNNYSFRLTIPDGKRETLRGDCWNKAMATQALDLLEFVYGFNRKSIRFEES